MSTLSKAYITEKWKHVGFQRYLKNTGWMFAGRTFSLVVSFFVSVYTAKHLGATDFGTLNFVTSFVSITGASIFVVDSILFKKLHDDPAEKDKIFGSALVIKLINAVCSIIVATLASLFFVQDQAITVMVFIFSTATIFQSVNAIDIFFKVKADVSESSVANIITNTITSIVRIVVISLGFPVLYLLATYVFDSILFTISYLYLYKRNFGNMFDWRVDKKMVGDIIKKSWPFTMSALATTIYVSVDQVFLKFLIGSKAVGLYVVAVRFSEVWFFISSVICTALLPAILNAQKVNHELFIERSKKLYALLFYISLGISVFVFAVAPIIIHTLYGAEYVQSITLLRVYIWSIIGFFLSTAVQQVLLAQNRFKTILVLNLLGMSLSLILNPVFIHLFGIVGAAVANICAYTLPVILLFSSRRMKDHKVALVSGVLNPVQFIK